MMVSLRLRLLKERTGKGGGGVIELIMYSQPPNLQKIRHNYGERFKAKGSMSDSLLGNQERHKFCKRGCALYTPGPKKWQSKCEIPKNLEIVFQIDGSHTDSPARNEQFPLPTRLKNFLKLE
ncbi:hypothetical protein GDO81_025933 [Engystomops pustulosus]|uniref:Uncharacterized protein n=1 Tax=Engystomops pustulosus TaxID=76066 RepID=A0AAV6Z9F0_ENGPU|nr:hypothetical protein GDO81_025933 [Engystomops pustulosus]